MMDTCLIGLDIGTTSCKSLVVDGQGRVRGSGILPYPVASPSPGWAEQDVETILAAVLQVVRDSVASARISPELIRGIGLSAAFHSLVAVDAQGEALTKALIWADTRSAEHSHQIKREYDAHRIYQRTGCPLHPMYLLAKIAWLRSHSPQAYRKAHKFISIKEYVTQRLLGRYVVDRSIASGTGLFNIHELTWDDEVLDIIGLTPDRLSEHISTTTILEGIRPSYAAAMGLRPDIVLIIGAGDGVLSNVGAGSVEPGQLTSMIGSSGALRVISDRPKIDDQERTWCYLLTDDRWLVGGAINNAGIVYRWFRDKFCSAEIKKAKASAQDPYDLLNEYAARVRPGSDGLLFLPYLTGERSPYWNPNARGILFGLSLHHERGHLIRAIMEGVAYRMYSVLLALEEVAGGFKEIRAAGGFLRSPLWTQILTDVYGREISIPQVVETSALGAIFLSMYALGDLRDLKEARQYVPIREIYTPDMIKHKEYARLFDIYQRIYGKLADEFDEISEIQRAYQRDHTLAES